MESHCGLVILDELVEFFSIAYIQLTKTKEPFVNIHGMLVAYGRGFQEIIGIFLSLGLRNILLDIFIKSNSLVQIYGLELVEIYIIINLS